MNHSLVIKNGVIVTMNKKREVFKGDIIVENDKIVDVIKGESKESGKTIVDAEGGIVVPGLICSHTHLYGILLRGSPLKISPPSDFTQNLQRIWWPMDETMNKDDAYISALTASLEMLRSGVTMFADTFSGPNAIDGVLDYIERGVTEAGMKGIISFEATQRRSVEEGYRGLEEDIRFIKKGGKKVKGMISLHASFTVTDDLIKKAVEERDKLDVPFTIHTSEGKWDLYHNLERYGKRTFERLRDLNALGPRSVVAHAVNVNEDELNIIRETGTNVAHNPLSNMLNAVGTAPVPEMMRMGINVSLGNDGYVFDEFENIRAAYLMHKLNKLDPRVMGFLDVLEMATVNAAKAYRLENVGSIEPGKSADVAVIKPLIRPTPLTESSAYAYLVNSVNSKDVDTVIIDGRVVLSKGVPTMVDLEKVNKKALEMVGNYWERLRTAGEKVEVLKQ